MEKKMARKKAEPNHIVRIWTSSPIVYGPLHSKDHPDVSPNPDHHPTIRLTHKGTFLNEAGDVLDPRSVPDYIKAEAKKSNLDIEYHPPRQRSLSMEDAMLGAGVENTNPDPSTRGRRVAREVFA